MGTHHIVGYLISMAVGYWVITLAKKEDRFYKTMGLWVGTAIIIVSVFGVLCSGACKVMECRTASACHTTEAGCCTTGSTGRDGCKTGPSASTGCPFSFGHKSEGCDMKGMEHNTPAEKAMPGK